MVALPGEMPVRTMENTSHTYANVLSSCPEVPVDSGIIYLYSMSSQRITNDLDRTLLSITQCRNLTFKIFFDKASESQTHPGPGVDPYLVSRTHVINICSDIL